MKNLSKRIISVFLSLLMVLSLFPMPAAALEMDNINQETYHKCGDFAYNDLFTINGVTYAELFCYSGSFSTLVLPTQLDGKKVVGVDHSFSAESSKTPTTIIVPDGYEYIDGMGGFDDLTITLPSSLKIIKRQAFQNASIKSIKFPNELEAIASSAFNGATFSDTDIVLPDGLKYIADCAFLSTNITSIHLGKNVNFASINKYEYGVDITAVDKVKQMDNARSFVSDCGSLTKITVDPDNPYLSALDDKLLVSKDKSILWCYPKGLEKCDFTVPACITDIADYAFDGAQFGQFVLPNSVTTLNEFSFLRIHADSFEWEENSVIKELPLGLFGNAVIGSAVEIPNSVERVCQRAFGATDVPEIKWEQGSNCTVIESGAFEYAKMTKITIPASVSELGEITDSNVFSNCTNLTDIVFEEHSDITVWGEDLFKNCTALKNISIGKGSLLRSIFCRFDNTAIESLDLSNCFALSFIDYYCFSNNTTLKHIDMSNTNLYSLHGVFEGATNLESVVLSNNTYEIGSYIFRGCKSLKTINTDNLVRIYDRAFAGCTSLEGDIPTSPEKKCNDDFYYYEGKNSIAIAEPVHVSENADIRIPSQINGKPVTSISENAFAGLTVNSITIPNTVERICNYAFSSTIVKAGITLPDNVEYIGEYAFKAYQNTTDAVNRTMVIPGSVRRISAYAFYCSGIDSVMIHEGVQSIANCAFNATDIEVFHIPDSILYLGRMALNTTNLKAIDFGAGVRNINEFVQDSFSNPDFQSQSGEVITSDLRTYPAEYNISADNKYYKSIDGVIYNTDLTELVAFPCSKNFKRLNIPKSVHTIGSYAFGMMNRAQAFVIPSTITTIRDYAFYNTISLESVFIPSSITSIGDSAFAKSESLVSVEFDDDLHLMELNATFSDCKAIKNVTFGDHCNIDALYATFYKSGIESIDLDCGAPILTKTFMYSSLREVKLHNGIETIEYGAFQKTLLKKIVIPDTVTFIGGRVFEDCEALSYVDLANVQGLGYAAFSKCISLESIDLTGVYYIEQWGDSYTFYGCDNLKKFYFTKEEKEAYIAANEFEGNETLETVVIGNNVTEIQDRAFANCTNLEFALIADEVDKISDTAFDNCHNLTIVCLSASPAMYYAKRNNIRYQTVQSFVVSPIPNQTYTGKAIKPALTVKQGGKKLKVNADYSAKYSNNINIGRAKVVVTGLGDYKIFGTTVNFNIVAPKHTHRYTSKVTKAATCGKTGVRTYTCSCGKKFTEIIKATGKHKYKSKVTKAPTSSAAGTMTYTCSSCGKKYTKSIAKLVKTSISSLTARSKGFKVNWKKVSSASGYQVQYATNKKFIFTKKTSTITKKSTTSKTLSKLKGKKKYYVRVRTYRSINGKKYYSSWSTAKAVTTKK